MATVTVSDSTLVVEIDGLSRFLSGRKRMEFPLGHVRSAARAPDYAHSPWQGTSTPGPIPKFATAGVFTRDGHRTFWNARNPEKSVSIELTDDSYSRLLLEVADPAATVTEVSAALRAQRPHS